MDPLALHIESLIYTGNPSISFDDIKNALEDSLGTTFSDNEIAAHIESLRDKYNSDQYSVEIVEIAGGFRFMTKALYHHTIGTYLRQNTHKKLSKSALINHHTTSHKILFKYSII